MDTAGLVFWVETLHAQDMVHVAEGFIGAPGETTIVHERPTDVTVTTKAVPEVTLGDPAHDVAIVTGDVPEGAMLVFQAYRQTGAEAVCDIETWCSTRTTNSSRSLGQANMCRPKWCSRKWARTSGSKRSTTGTVRCCTAVSAEQQVRPRRWSRNR